MKRPLKPGESSLSSAKIAKRLSKLNLSTHSTKKFKKKHYLNAPHNTTSFLINEFNRNKSPPDEDCDIPQGSMKDLMNSSADFYKSSFDDITFLCL